MESGTDTCRERLSVRMVVSLGVASVGTLRAGTEVDGSCTLRDAAGCCGVWLLESAPGGVILMGMAGVGGSKGASDGWLGLLMP